MSISGMRGRLRQVKAPGVTLAYGYDAADRRIERVHNGSRQQYLLDGVYSHWPQVLAEYGSGGMTAWHDYGLGRVRRDGHTVLADALGSTRALVDSQGAVSARYRYDAQGQLRESSGSQASQPFRYTGEFWEDGADAYHLRARDYLPELGRFNQRDSWQDDRQRSITLNAYLYGDANPVMNIDPSGNFSLSSLSAGMRGAWALAVQAVAATGKYTLNCAKTTAMITTVMVGGGMSNKQMFGQAIKGTGWCGIGVWSASAVVAYRANGFRPGKQMAASTVNWSSYNSMRGYLNNKIWYAKGGKNAFPQSVKGSSPVVSGIIEWHHLVEQESRHGSDKKAINNILNVVPFQVLLHRSVSATYTKTGTSGGGLSPKASDSIRSYLGNTRDKNRLYSRHWRIGLCIWHDTYNGFFGSLPNSLLKNVSLNAGCL